MLDRLLVAVAEGCSHDGSQPNPARIDDTTIEIASSRVTVSLWDRYGTAATITPGSQSYGASQRLLARAASE